MSWREKRARDAGRHMEHHPVAHDGRVVWLWHAEGKSAVYDPRADRWADLAHPFGGSGVRAGAVVVSAGPTLVVWGGAAKSWFGSRDYKTKDDGVRLEDGTFRPLASQRAPSQRSGALSAWTGKELVIVGGYKAGKPARGGAAYDPKADTWRRIAARELDARREDSLWTGKELWAWDSSDERMGHAYDPATDTWRDLGGLPMRAANARAMSTCGDGALFVCREGHFGSDIDGCAVWRYEPRANLWEPSTPPPVTRGGEPRLVDCDGRIILGLDKRVFEYMPAKDAWGELPPHDLDDAHLVWVDGALLAFGREATRALELPPPPTALPAPPAPTVLAAPPAPAPVANDGSPVTALAVADGAVLAGHLDGTVRRLAEYGIATLREADGERVLGLALMDGAVTCLVGTHLELLGGQKKAKPRRISLGFAGHMLAHRGRSLVIAGDGVLAAFTWAGDTWKPAREVKTKGQTTQVSLFGDTVARCVLGPPKEKGTRTEPRDTIELRDAATLKLRESIVPPYARGSVSAMPTDGGALVGGIGHYRTERYARGKKRAVGGIHETPLLLLSVSDDGRWLFACDGLRGVALFDLEDEHRELRFEAISVADRSALAACQAPLVFLTPEEAKEAPDYLVRSLGVIAIDPDARTLAIGTAGGGTFVIDRERLGITSYDASGKAITLQPPRGAVVARVGPGATIVADHEQGLAVQAADGRHGRLDVATGVLSWGAAPGSAVEVEDVDGGTPFPSLDGTHVAVAEGQRDIHGWRRWRIYGADKANPRFLELPEHASELGVLPGGALAMRHRTSLRILHPDGRPRASFDGHGADLLGMCPSPDGRAIVVWDRYGVVRRWELEG